MLRFALALTSCSRWCRTCTEGRPVASKGPRDRHPGPRACRYRVGHRNGGVVIFEMTPRGLAPVFRHAPSMKSATARADKEFPEGIESLRVLLAPQLSKLAESEVMLPASARVTLAAYTAVEAAKRQAATAAAKRDRKAAERAHSTGRGETRCGRAGEEEGQGRGEEGKAEGDAVEGAGGRGSGRHRDDSGRSTRGR